MHIELDVHLPPIIGAIRVLVDLLAMHFVSMFISLNTMFSRFLVKRCLSDGNILHESRTPMSAMSSKHESISHKGFVSSRQVNHVTSESSPDMPAAGDVSLSRFV